MRKEYKEFKLETLTNALKEFFKDRPIGGINVDTMGRGAREELHKAMIEEARRQGWISDEYEYILCDCPCHTNPGIDHIVPCCDDGVLKVIKKSKNESNNQESDKGSK